MKSKTIYWLTDTVLPVFKERAEYLLQKGVEVYFFNDINSLLDYYSKKRVNVIVISDDFRKEILQATLTQISSLPNLYGVRLILSVQQNVPSLIKQAYELGFRDIIPFDLDGRQWLHRFLFSISGSEIPFTSPHPHVGLKAIGGVFIPARIVWISNDRIRFLRGELEEIVELPMLYLPVISNGN